VSLVNVVGVLSSVVVSFLGSVVEILVDNCVDVLLSVLVGAVLLLCLFPSLGLQGTELENLVVE